MRIAHGTRWGEFGLSYAADHVSMNGDDAAADGAVDVAVSAFRVLLLARERRQS